MTTLISPLSPAARSPLASLLPAHEAGERCTVTTPPVPGADEHAMQRIRRRGIALLVLGLGGFICWSALAPIDEAVAGSGMVAVAGQRKAVQPAVGGALASLSVQEGEAVRAGQVLMQVDVQAQQAELVSTRRQLLLAEASHVRLSALLANEATLAFAADLARRAEAAQATPLLAEQRALFAQQRQARASERTQLLARATQLQGDARHFAALAEQQRAQRELAETQFASLAELAQTGHYPRVRLMDNQRQLGIAQVEERRSRADAQRSREQVADAHAEQLRRDSEQRSAWETERLDLERQQAQLRARLAGLEQTIAQAAVVAPVSGTVVGLNVHSTGAVVQPAQTLLEIVPQDDALMVDARFPLASGEKLVAGMPADLRLTTLDSAATPVVQGRVLTVSADRLEDSRTGEPYLRVQVAVPAAERQRLAADGIILRAGLPAEVHARLGERTLLGQMLKPVTDRLARALAG